MKALKNSSIFALLIMMCLFLCVGYAIITDMLSIGGSADVTPSLPDGHL